MSWLAALPLALALAGASLACAPPAPAPTPARAVPTASAVPTSPPAAPAPPPTAALPARPPATPSPTPHPPGVSPGPSPAGALRFVSVVGGRPGDRARVVVQARPGAACTIRYTTPAGTVSRAQGLAPTTADASGQASWSWVIGTATRPGTGRVEVTCDDATISAPIQIG